MKLGSLLLLFLLVSYSTVYCIDSYEEDELNDVYANQDQALITPWGLFYDDRYWGLGAGSDSM